jgi:hypothetical protein
MANTGTLTYNQNGNREDLSDIITNITPTETPMFSSFAKSTAKASYHEWMIEELASATTNAQLEGADYSFSASTARTRTGNYTQILSKSWDISNTQEAVDKAGITSEYVRRLENSMKEIARDAEYALVNGTGNAGASGTARSLKGVLAWITTTNVTGSATGTQQLTELLYNDAMQLIAEQGGSPDKVFCNGWQKRKISAMTANATRNLAAGDKKLVSSVDVYEGDFGMQAIKYDRFMPTDKIALLETSKWALAWLRPFKSEEVAKISDSKRGVIVGEFTLTSYNQKASGKVTELTTS